MINISFIVPGIRTTHWPQFYETLKKAVKKYTFETIFIGPKILPETLTEYKDIKYIKDNGSPSRCCQIGASLAEGDYFGLLADDSIFIEDTIDQSMDLLLSKNKSKDLVALRHIQTNNYNGITEGFNQRDPLWWMATTHPILNQSYVNKNWKITCNPLMSLSYYKLLGGIDCRFHHVNYNVHDLTFRAQLNDSQVYISPNIVANTPVHTSRPSNDPLMLATTENDEPLYRSIWSNQREIKIDFENWRNSSRNWP